MYHTHKATKQHDKVYALLGMSSDDLSEAGLMPNYGLPWEELLRRLTKFLLYEKVSVETWSDREMAVIKSKGCVLGKVSTKTISAWNNKQRVDISFKNSSRQMKHMERWSAHWTLQNSAKPIQNGDLICILQGTSKPIIIRPHKDCFTIISIAINPENIRIENGDIEWLEVLQSIKQFNRDFLLVWDWGNPTGELKYQQLYKNSAKPYSQPPDLDEATRTWDVGLVLEDSGDNEKADERLGEAIHGYEMVFNKKHSKLLKGQYGLTPLTWAAGYGYDEIVDFLLTKDGVNPDLEDSEYGGTPLLWAAWNGHETTVKLLLRTGKVNIEVKDSQYGRTPLSWAAGNGHEAIVKLLLKTGKVDVDAKDSRNKRTPLSFAAGNGHLEIVKLLLNTGKVDVDVKDNLHERTPLSWAAGSGHEAMVKLLLDTGKVNVNARANEVHLSWTALQYAKKNRHDAVVKLLRSYINHSR